MFFLLHSMTHIRRKGTGYVYLSTHATVSIHVPFL